MLSPYKKKTYSRTSFTLMSCRGIVEEKTTKSDPIYHNRLVNMLVNHILKHGKKIIGLSNYLSNFEKNSTIDKIKFTITNKVMI